jgi:hypothetical protein
MKKKPFDCVEMKRRGAARIHEHTEDMTVGEEIEDWRRRSQEFMGTPENEVEDTEVDKS